MPWKTVKPKIRKPKSAESMAKMLDGVALPSAKAYETCPWHSFRSWVDDCKTVRCKDRARHVLYYGFQPLYDALVEERVPEEHREKAVKVLDRVMEASIRYLTGYYLGKSDASIARSLGKEIEADINSMSDEIEYTSKFRNIDYNGISPKDILLFLREFAKNFKDKPLPRMVVACACGSSEVAMPLAGLLGCSLAFMRRSHRRGDDEPKIVKEHVPVLKKAEGVHIVCLEDYCCTGKSLRRVMDASKEFGPASIRGVSVNNMGGNDLKELCSVTKFNLFE